jgi:hypothetical protein
MGKVLYPGYFPFDCDQPFLPQYFIFNSNLEQAMKMYWRVKTWRVSATISGRTVGGSPTNGTYVSDCHWDVESEEGLVCPGLQFLCSDPGGNWENFGFALYQNTDGNSIAAGLLFTPSGDSGEPSISSVKDDFNKPGGTLSLENFGEGGSCTTYVPNSTLPEYGSISLSIRAEEYWSYGGTYDTETGARL